MEFFGDFGGNAMAVEAAVAAGAVPSTPLDQEAVGPEDGIGPLQLLPQGHREIARGTAVQPHLFFQQI